RRGHCNSPMIFSGSTLALRGLRGNRDTPLSGLRAFLARTLLIGVRGSLPLASPRVETQSGPPDDRSGNGDGCCEVAGEFVVTGGDAAPVLQPAQGAFDDVAALVGFCDEGVEAFARRIVRDHRKGAALEEELS